MGILLLMMNESETETALPADSQRQVTDEMKSHNDVDCHVPLRLGDRRYELTAMHEPACMDLL